MSLMVQASYGDVIDASLQRKLALPLTTVQEYATRVTHAVAAGRAPVSTQTDK